MQGEKHHAAKLTTEQVKAIRLDMRSNRAIAVDYGVSGVTIHAIKRGKLWRHVEGVMMPQPGTKDLRNLVYGEKSGIDIQETCKLLGLNIETIINTEWAKGCVEDRVKASLIGRKRKRNGSKWAKEDE